MNFEQFFDDVISGHNDIIGCWFFTASKVLGWSLIILKNWGHSTYQYYVTFSESDPSFRFSQMKKSWKMNLFDRSNPCFRVSRYRWIRWWYQIFDILNIGTFRFLKLKGPNRKHSIFLARFPSVVMKACKMAFGAPMNEIWELKLVLLE